MRTIFQIFEHQKISVGDRVGEVIFSNGHFQALVNFAPRRREKYFTLGHQCVRLKSYVGVIQIGDLTIEILPKADRHPSPAFGLWQSVLLEMLRECRIIRPETSQQAGLGIKYHRLLDVFIDHFLSEVETLVRQGLLKTYSRTSGQERTLKGKLCLHRHLTNNFIHRERFYTERDTYDHRHPFNLLLREALVILNRMPSPINLASRLKNLLQAFPPADEPKMVVDPDRPILTDRKTERYRNALELARMIIANFSPDTKGGRFPTLALLFDMNTLFEEYIYRRLRAALSKDMAISRQLSRSFWGRRYIRPDLVLNTGRGRVVLDTKWKVLKKAAPSGADLRQVYVYNQFFGADQGVLLYPKVYELENIPPVPFTGTDSSCRLIFVRIIRDGRLNRDLGIELLEGIVRE